MDLRFHAKQDGKHILDDFVNMALTTATNSSNMHHHH